MSVFHAGSISLPSVQRALIQFDDIRAADHPKPGDIDSGHGALLDGASGNVEILCRVREFDFIADVVQADPQHLGHYLGSIAKLLDPVGHVVGVARVARRTSPAEIVLIAVGGQEGQIEGFGDPD